MPSQRTLLLCFIHGFKGDENTFGNFPQQLRSVVASALPSIAVEIIIYPTFDTRGDLDECVARFREWLQNKVIDLEVAAGTPSPTVSPSVRVILIGHSMGGIVAADALLAIAGESALPQSSSATASPAFMFPYIQGILAFDTPYLGIAPSVLAHASEKHYRTATTAYTALASAASLFTARSPPSRAPDSSKALPVGPEAVAAAAAAAAASTEASTASSSAAWRGWGKTALYAGAGAAVAAAAAGGAYWQRDQLTEGWGWAAGHLEFVGCLMRGEEMRRRLAGAVDVCHARGLGFRDLVTVLGAGGRRAGRSVAGGWMEVGGVEGGERPFCNLPAGWNLAGAGDGGDFTTSTTAPATAGESKSRGRWAGLFEAMVNDKAADEVGAHMYMFAPAANPGFFGMRDRARELVVEWAVRGWGVPEGAGMMDEVLEGSTAGFYGEAERDEEEDVKAETEEAEEKEEAKKAEDEDEAVEEIEQRWNRATSNEKARGAETGPEAKEWASIS